MFEDLCLKVTLSEARMVGALPKPRQFHERILLVPNNRNVRSQVEPENKRVVRKRKSTLRKSQSTSTPMRSENRAKILTKKQKAEETQQNDEKGCSTRRREQRKAEPKPAGENPVLVPYRLEKWLQ